MRHSSVDSVGNLPWVVLKEKGRGEAKGGLDGNPTKGMRGCGGNRRKE